IVQADAVNRGDADGPGNDVLDFLQPAVERLEGLDDLFAVFVEHLPFAGEPELLFAAFNQQRFELAFQRADLLADRRLGHMVDLRRLGETFRLRQITKHLQAFDLHGRIESETPAGVNLVVISVNPVTFVAPHLAWGEARGGSIPRQWGCDRRATKPQAKWGATLRAAVLCGPGGVARSLQ